MLRAFPAARRRSRCLLPLLAVFGAGSVGRHLGLRSRCAGLLFTGIAGLGIIWHCVGHALLRAIARGSRDLSGRICSPARSPPLAAIVMVARASRRRSMRSQHGRATGTFVLPGELAGYLIVLLPVAYALGCVARDARLRTLAWIALAVGLVALALTYSRAGWMGFAAACAFLLAVRTRRGLAARPPIVLGGIVAVLLLFNAHHDPSEDYTRLSIWQAALQIVDRFPLTGVGPFDFSRLYALVRAPDGDPTAFHAHSLYLTFFAEIGIVGLAAVAWTIWRSR